MNPITVTKSYDICCIIMSAMAQATIFITLPDMWIVAQRGMTKPAMLLFTPLAIVCRRVTGIVAAEDCVPSAVK